MPFLLLLCQTQTILSEKSGTLALKRGISLQIWRERNKKNVKCGIYMKEQRKLEVIMYVCLFLNI